MSGQPVLTCTGLGKTFRDFWLRERVVAVRDVDLEVRPGEIFGLIGPNGCGKSTTIKLILGLLFPTRGTIRVFDKPARDVRAKARIGYLPEETHLYPFLDARETLDFIGRLFGIPAAERKARIDTLLALVGLAGEQQRPLIEYSKGMQRRIGLAQALINDPDLLILDEPTNGLDPLGTRQVKDLILSLKARGKTVLVTSHLLAELEEICDRVAIMYGGSVLRVGPLAEILDDSSSMQLRTDPLDPALLEKIEAVLRAGGKQLQAVGKPRQSLEAFFLKIVEQARGAGAPTRGAQAPERPRGFLAPPAQDGRS